jgi:hypothetical protein
MARLLACREGEPQHESDVPRSAGAPTCETEQPIRSLLGVALRDCRLAGGLRVAPP